MITSGSIPKPCPHYWEGVTNLTVGWTCPDCGLSYLEASGVDVVPEEPRDRVADIIGLLDQINRKLDQLLLAPGGRTFIPVRPASESGQ